MEEMLDVNAVSVIVSDTDKETVQVIQLKVHGTPAPQGSMRSIGKGRMISDNPNTKIWREAVVSEVLRRGHIDQLPEGPLVFRATFYHRRLKKHYKMLNSKPILRPDAPMYVDTTPDLDKVCRSTFDALTQSGVIKDDKYIVIIHAQQVYSNDDFVGAMIQIGPVDA